MNNTIADETNKYQCPNCGVRFGLRFAEIPESVRIYSKGSEQTAEHFGASRDYWCKNCEHEWNQAEEEA